MATSKLLPASDLERWMDASLFPQAVDTLEASTILLKLNACLFSVASIRPRIATMTRMPLKARTYCGEFS